MSVSELIKILRERWIFVVASVVLVLALAVLVTAVSPREYESRLILYVSSQTSSGDNPVGAYQGGLLSEQRVKSYTQLVSSSRITQPVISELGLPYTPDSLASRISATAESDSVLLNVSVTDESPSEAERIANAIGPAFTALVADLERPLDANRPSAIAARIVQPATAGQLVSPSWLLNLLVGLLLGLIAGVSLAVARDRFDRTVKSEEQLKDLVGAPNLGVTLFNSEIQNEAIVVSETSQTPDAEAIKQIRVNLQFIDVDNPQKLVVLSSATPGEGKTTLACNLAVAAASAGSRVLLIEADLRRPKAADYLGLTGSVGLTSVLVGRINVREATQNVGRRFDFLASGPLPPNPSELVGSGQMQQLLMDLRSQYDLVLIDAPPLLPVSDAAVLAGACDGLVLVGRYGMVRTEQVKAAVNSVSSVNGVVLGSVFTAVPERARKRYGGYSAYYYASADGPVSPAPPQPDTVGEALTSPALRPSPEQLQRRPSPARRNG